MNAGGSCRHPESGSALSPAGNASSPQGRSSGARSGYPAERPPPFSAVRTPVPGEHMLGDRRLGILLEVLDDPGTT